MTNGEFCIREVLVAEKEATVSEIARLMRDYHVGDVVIVRKEEKKTIPVGIVTDRDLVLKVIAKERPVDLPVEAIMSKELKVVYDKNSLWETMEVMRTNGVRRVPVVNSDNELIGILSADDLVDIIEEEVSALVRTVIKEKKRESGGGR